MLAAKWLAAGYGSPSLRQLAKLRPGKTRAARLDALDLMPKVLRLIGFDPSPGNEEFRARCQNAVDIVQHDLVRQREPDALYETPARRTADRQERLGGQRAGRHAQPELEPEAGG